MPPMTRMDGRPAWRRATASSRKAVPRDVAPSEDEMARDLDQAMPIGVGLDDRHHHGCADGGLDGAEVLAEARQADLDDGRPQDAGVGKIGLVAHAKVEVSAGC